MLAMKGAAVIEPLVSTEWLAAHLADAEIVLLDASYHLPESGRQAHEDYRNGHIPGAAYMDLARLKDDDSPLPSMMPSASHYRRHMGALGVGNDTHVVLYDDSIHKTSARAWVVLRHFGFDRVSIVDGGLGKWRAEDRPLEKREFAKLPRMLTAGKERDDIRTLAQVQALVSNGREQIVDARGAARFSGEEAETRPGLASGHIPGSANLPYTRLFNADGTWKRGQALRDAFVNAGVDLSRPIVTSCGSGITASALLFGAFLLGKEDMALYDGSWTEWGAHPSTPKATGTA